MGPPKTGLALLDEHWILGPSGCGAKDMPTCQDQYADKAEIVNPSLNGSTQNQVVPNPPHAPGRRIGGKSTATSNVSQNTAVPNHTVSPLSHAASS